LRDTRLARPASPDEEFVHQRQKQFLTDSAAAVGIETAADILDLVKSGNPQQRRACDGEPFPGLAFLRFGRSENWPFCGLAAIGFLRSCARPQGESQRFAPPAVGLGAVAVAATGVRQANHSQGI
jgi:hypothetical protein